MIKKTQKNNNSKLLIRGENISFWLENLKINGNINRFSPREIENIVVDYQINHYLSVHVIFNDYSNFYIEGLPEIGEGTSISTGVFINKKSVLGKDIKIFPNCYIENSIIEDSSVILPSSVIRDSHIKSRTMIGPYSHLRNGAVIEQGAKVGNFVEMKKTIFGRDSKAMHLSYLGDSDIGSNVNIGAGTITCNYDGINKNPTTIKNGVFIGSGTELIAPVTIEENSYVAAGSTINADVPSDSLAIARERQRIIKGWTKRKRKQKSD